MENVILVSTTEDDLQNQTANDFVLVKVQETGEVYFGNDTANPPRIVLDSQPAYAPLFMLMGS